MRWTDQFFVYSSGRLNGDELIHEGFVNAATKLAERLRQHKVGLGGRDLILTEATGIHDGKVRTQAMADIFVGGTQLRLEQLQSEQDADGHRPSATRGWSREPCIETLLDG